MLKQNQTAFTISKKGEIKECVYLKPAFAVRFKEGKCTAVYRIYGTREEAVKALVENGGRVIRQMDTLAGMNMSSDLAEEIELLKLKIDVLSIPWYQKIFNRFFRKED